MGQYVITKRIALKSELFSFNYFYLFLNIIYLFSFVHFAKRFSAFLKKKISEVIKTGVCFANGLLVSSEFSSISHFIRF